MSELAGMSGSDAVAVKVKRTFSTISELPIGSSTGARLTSLTVIVTTSESLSTGRPLSSTITVTL